MEQKGLFSQKANFDDRPPKDYCLMETAVVWSRRSTCPRGSVGAVLAMGTRIISIGYGGPPPGEPHCTEVGCLIEDPKEGCIRTIHAEINAIGFAARYGISTEGSTMYVTLSPCFRCSQAILAAGVKKLVYMMPYRDTRGIDFLSGKGVEVVKFPRL